MRPDRVQFSLAHAAVAPDSDGDADTGPLLTPLKPGCFPSRSESARFPRRAYSQTHVPESVSPTKKTKVLKVILLLDGHYLILCKFHTFYNLTKHIF